MRHPGKDLTWKEDTALGKVGEEQQTGTHRATYCMAWHDYVGHDREQAALSTILGSILGS